MRLPEGGVLLDDAAQAEPGRRRAHARVRRARPRARPALLLDLEHEHERAAGAWHAEWKALSDALAFAGGAAASLRETLEGLEVDAERMRANLSAETMSEAERFAPDAREPEDYSARPTRSSTAHSRSTAR